MTTVTEARGISYSAEATGKCGTLRCHVVRRRLIDEARAHYSIFVSNETDADAAAAGFVSDGTSGRYRTILRTAVAAAADFSSTVTLNIPSSGSLPELHVTLTAGDIDYTLSVPALMPDAALLDGRPAAALPPMTPISLERQLAPMPAAVTPIAASPGLAHVERNASAQPSPPVTPIVLGAATIAALAAFVAFQPRVSDLRIVPAPVSAIRHAVNVWYQTTGLGMVDYAVLDPAGRKIAEAPLTMGRGSFAVVLPPTAPAAYLVRVQVHSPLGTATADTIASVAAPQVRPTSTPMRSTPAVVAPPPQIRSLALDRATLVSGDTLNVYYDVDSTDGTVALIDPASQITYARWPLTTAGHASFTAPHTDAARFLSVVVNAARSGVTTQSRIELTVTPLDSASAANASGAPVLGTDGFGERSDGTPTATSIGAPASVHSGQPIHVALTGGAGDIEVIFLDGSGAEVARRDLRAGQSGAVFTAPAVTRPTRFVLEATFRHGAGSESVVRPVVIEP